MKSRKYDTQRYAAALKYALDAHGGQLRKGSAIPYITHPVAVSALLAQFGYSEDLVIAGLLHDTIEDPKVPYAELERDFGRHVADLVAGVTEEKERDAKKLPWRERKEGVARAFQDGGSRDLGPQGGRYAAQRPVDPAGSTDPRQPGLGAVQRPAGGAGLVLLVRGGGDRGEPRPERARG